MTSNHLKNPETISKPDFRKMKYKDAYESSSHTKALSIFKQLLTYLLDLLL